MRIHWFSITIFDDPSKRNMVWNDYFTALGVLVSTGHGGRSYRQIEEGLLAVKVYHDPVRQDHHAEQHYHIEIPGQACDALLPSVFASLLAELIANGIRFNIKRLDLAFDDVPFSPQDFLDAVQSNDLISLAKRETIRVDSSPRAQAEDASHIGTTTVYLGANSSERMVRVYDKRGPVRLEFQLRDKRAQAIALDMFSKPYEDWESCAKGHLRQYLDFSGRDWWRLFTNMVVRNDLRITSARAASFEGLHLWLNKQVSVALSVWFDIQGEEAREQFGQMLARARKRNRTKYAAILELGDQGVDIPEGSEEVEHESD